MFTLVKTVILPLDPATNKGKINQLTQLTQRCTFGMSLFLDVAREQNVSARGELERFRHVVQQRTDLSSGLTQACRDRASALVKAWKNKRDKWQKKVKKLETEIQKLEDRRMSLEHQLWTLSPRAIKTRAKKENILTNTQDRLVIKQERLARLLSNSPGFPEITRRQPIWFDYRIGNFVKAKKTTNFKYWVSISTIQKRKKLLLPVQVYPYAERLLRGSSWQHKSFCIVWNCQRKKYAVHLKLEKSVAFEQLHEAWGIDLGIKRLVYAINDNNSTILLDGNDPTIFLLLSRLKTLENRIARLQRLEKTCVLQKFRRKRYVVAEQLRNVVAKKTVSSLPDKPVLLSIGQPKKIRENKGVRMKNSTNGNKTSKKHRKRLHRWSFKAQGGKLFTKSLEYGHLPLLVTEWWTTHTCNRCGSRDVTINDRQFKCNECGCTGDRDGNGGLNISDLGKQQFVKLQQSKKEGNPLKNVVCDFPLPKTSNWNEKAGGRSSRCAFKGKADVNRPRTCNEPALTSGGSTKNSGLTSSLLQKPLIYDGW